MKPEHERRANSLAAWLRMYVLLSCWGLSIALVVSFSGTYLPGGLATKLGWLSLIGFLAVVLVLPAVTVLASVQLVWFLVLTKASEAWKQRLRPRARYTLVPVVSSILFAGAVFALRPLDRAFSISRVGLDRLADAGDAGGRSAAAGWAGVYRVQEVATDERGGTYLLTGTSPDLIDTNFHGFARSPNGEGSPFGNAYYELEHLADDWYVFTANNDW